MKKSLILLFILVVIFLIYPLPKPLFETPYSTLLEDRNGELLSATISDDGQWRFPEGNVVPDKFATCITYFEDEYFRSHPGVNPISLGRAMKQNWKANRVVSGGSTLTMQIARMANKNQARTVWNKLTELLLALKVELVFSKNEILQLYTAHAPFGGNVVGLEAASWRYFNRSSEQLSWAESASLAVLPNAPSLIRPGKNEGLFLAKRNRLLKKLKDKDVIDQVTYELALEEELPGKPHALPRHAVHLLNKAVADGKKGEQVQTTIDLDLQRNVNRIVEQNYFQLRQNQIHNLAVLVLDNKSNQVLSYVGNSNPNAGNNGHQVDVIQANRSTGSLLKPFLYAMAWQEGLAVPNSILPDIPTQYGGYAPKNFNKKYDGAVSASEALVRSLNVPAVRLLREYKLERFYDELQEFPLNSVSLGADHYGLSIILGGAESSLWEICMAYKGMSESLRNVYDREYSYAASDYDFPSWIVNENTKEVILTKQTPLDAAAIWQTVENLKEVNRPGQEEGWESFAGRKKVAWKTGTSFGLRDAWAVGVSPDYTVGIWVGNADGEGRPGLTGISAAAPILFEVFDLLPENNWYNTPYDELFELEICTVSGFGKGVFCPEVDTILTGKNGGQLKSCVYHQQVQLNAQKTKRVNSSCYPVAEMQTESYFVLPPLMEHYYQKTNPNYRKLPNWQSGCYQEESYPMELISLENADKILIPVGLNGEKGSLSVEVAHRNSQATIHWYLDEEFIGSTKGLHQKEMLPNIGKHQLTLIDDDGNKLEKEFEIIK